MRSVGVKVAQASDLSAQLVVSYLSVLASVKEEVSLRQEELWPPLERFTLDQFDQIRDRQRYRQRDHRHGEGDTDTALHLGYRSTPRAQEERKMRGRERTNAEGGRRGRGTESDGRRPHLKSRVAKNQQMLAV